MAADIRVVPARLRHVAPIAARMRPADRDEVFAASGKSPADALVYSLRKSSVAWTAMVDGRPELMFGVGDVNVLAGVGAPWLLGTDAVEQHYRVFLRGSRRWLEQLLLRYAVLRNFVDDRNATSIRWLRWLGFELSDPVVLRDHEFRLFQMRRG